MRSASAPPQPDGPDRRQFPAAGGSIGQRQLRPSRPPAASRRRHLLPCGGSTRFWRRRVQHCSVRKRPAATPGAAHAGFRQFQLDARGGRGKIAGERCRDRAHLFMAGREQKGRRPAIALHAGDEEILSGCASSFAPCGRTVPQLCTLGSISGPMPAAHSSHGIQRQTDFAQHRKIGPESGRHDDLVRHEWAQARQPDSPSMRRRPSVRAISAMRNGVTASTAPLSTSARAWTASAPRSGSASAASPPKAVSMCSLRRSQRMCVRRRLLAQRGELDQRIKRRMPATDHGHGLARIARAFGAKHIGDAAHDAIRAPAPRRSPAARPRRQDWARSRCRRHRSRRAPRWARRRRCRPMTRSTNGSSSRPAVRTLSGSGLPR